METRPAFLIKKCKVCIKRIAEDEIRMCLDADTKKPRSDGENPLRRVTRNMDKGVNLRNFDWDKVITGDPDKIARSNTQKKRPRTVKKNDGSRTTPKPFHRVTRNMDNGVNFRNFDWDKVITGDPDKIARSITQKKRPRTVKKTDGSRTTPKIPQNVEVGNPIPITPQVMQEGIREIPQPLARRLPPLPTPEERRVEQENVRIPQNVDVGNPIPSTSQVMQEGIREIPQPLARFTPQLRLPPLPTPEERRVEQENFRRVLEGFANRRADERIAAVFNAYFMPPNHLPTNPPPFYWLVRPLQTPEARRVEQEHIRRIHEAFANNRAEGRILEAIHNAFFGPPNHLPTTAPSFYCFGRGKP